MIKGRNVIAMAALAMGFAGAGNAALIDFSYSGNTVATLTTTGNTDFALTFVSAPGGAAAYIDRLLLVGPGGTFSAASGQATFADDDYSATGLGDGNAFNWSLDFPNANNADRFTLGETYLWSITTTNPESWDLSKLHINAFLNGNSIKLDGCIQGSEECASVPEPATLALMGIGLIGAGLARRRRRA